MNADVGRTAVRGRGARRDGSSVRAISETADFLARHPPFDGLDQARLDTLAAAAIERTFAGGETILVEDGQPAGYAYVVRSGTVELRHDSHVVDVLHAGELFGHPSLLTGLAPAFDVVARSQATCLLLPAGSMRLVLESTRGVEFVAASLRQRMVRTGHVAHAQADVRTAHLGSLVHRPAVLCEPTTSAREAARMMAEADVSCVLVRLPDGYGVLTDSDLRRKLVAAGRSHETPVSELMVAPAIVFAADRLAIDAMIDMLDAGIHHLPVVDGRGTPVGVITATDLMYL
ncbi:MAG TPA: CBS domain-containing protein, partial [Gaiellales bacterium]|nr:CBS domain-containing protein [Gaiellales bacterium]